MSVQLDLSSVTVAACINRERVQKMCVTWTRTFRAIWDGQHTSYSTPHEIDFAMHAY
jgi:hypothetical protein